MNEIQRRLWARIALNLLVLTTVVVGTLMMMGTRIES